jgi:Uma2 family endonuclease
MTAQRAPRLFSIDEYMKMIDTGVFAPDDRIELIRGEIVQMAPIGFDHAFSLTNLVMLFAKHVTRSAIIWVQNPILIKPSNSRPQPDLVLLKPRNDLSPKSPPTAEDVILLIEVADTTIRFDRGVKLQLYAEAGVPEYWIINLRGDDIEVYSNPTGGTYKQTRKAKRGETLALPGELEGVVRVEEVLG